MEWSKSDNAEILVGRRGLETARVVGENGELTLLHSIYDPVREAEALAPERVDMPTVVFLGAGLGYHMPAVLAASPSISRAVIVEKYPNLAELAARRLTGLVERVQVVTMSEKLSSADLPHLPDDLCADKLRIIAHPPSLNANPRWYARCRAAIATAGQGTVAERRISSADGGGRTILALYGAYYGQNEALRGLESLGHRVVLLDYREREAEYLENFRRLILDERPDAVFSVNLHGMDRQGVMGEILQRLGIPLIVWFVDSPEFILYGDALPPPAITRLFLWDRGYLPLARGLGYDADWLPLAADETLTAFAHVDGRFSAPISFVGNSLMSGFLSRLAGKFPLTPEQERLAEYGQRHLLGQRGRQLEALDDLIAASPDAPSGGEALLFFRAFMLHGATTAYRTALLERLLALGLTFFGDPEGWRALFGPEINAHPDVNYFRETPRVYASASVNFNATSLQMPQAVNQRVFDVPICGGFLLTDRQPDLADLFAAGEVATYEGVDEAAERAAFFLANPAARKVVVDAARKRVLGEHTYRRRMGHMLTAVFGG